MCRRSRRPVASRFHGRQKSEKLPESTADRCISFAPATGPIIDSLDKRDSHFEGEKL